MRLSVRAVTAALFLMLFGAAAIADDEAAIAGAKFSYKPL